MNELGRGRVVQRMQAKVKGAWAHVVCRREGCRRVCATRRMWRQRSRWCERGALDPAGRRCPCVSVIVSEQKAFTWLRQWFYESSNSTLLMAQSAQVQSISTVTATQMNVHELRIDLFVSKCGARSTVLVTRMSVRKLEHVGTNIIIVDNKTA